MPTVRLANGKSFALEPRELILDAALRQGLVLEHSCRTGRCGTCRARVVAGVVRPVGIQSGLSSDSSDAGTILTCASESVSESVELDIDDVSELAAFPSRTLPCRIDALDRLAPDVVRVVLRYPPRSGGLPHLAGQSLDVIGPGGTRRSYSIANHADATGRTELHVREVAGGVLSRYWFGSARTNDLLRVQGPRGSFFLRDVAGLDLVFLATGTGIAPVRAMLIELATREPGARPASVSLYWGGRIPADLYWQPVVDGIDLRFTPVLSRADPSWTGARGHVQDVFLATRPALDLTAVYACGSSAMIDASQRSLSAAGLPPRRFFADAFVDSSEGAQALAA